MGLLDRIHAVDSNGARSRMQQGREHLDGRGLAGAVRAQEREYAPLRNFKGDVLHGRKAVLEGLGQVLDGYGGITR